MSRATLIRDAARPQTAQEREAILKELREVLASPHFCNSKRYPALLEYIVENTLAGRSELLKERTIGVEVFERPPAYDTNADTVVRYTAGEVRKRLSLYYHELGHKTPVQISLPAGSYVPEFLHPAEEAEAGAHGLVIPEVTHEVAAAPTVQAVPQTRSGLKWWLAAAVVAVVATLLFGLRARGLAPRTPIDAFWAPLLKDQHKVLLCSGGVVFKPENFSGVVTAGKDTDYPFVSSQIASSISKISGLVARSGGTVDLQFSAATPLTALRDQPAVMLGGYNNLWTLRLMDGLPLHFTRQGEAIVDTADASKRWARDQTQPYSSTDDFALIARFRDTTTDSWVVVLAGLGRNGTEAATQFATTPRYMQMLRDKAGQDFGNQNVEAVLKISVIEGKTGAPSILSVRTW
jgi:hypothetical protein